MKDSIFYTICFGFILGVFVRSFILVNVYVAALILLLACALLIIFGFIYKNKLGVVIITFVLFLSLGVMRFGSVDVAPPHTFEKLADARVSLMGEVVDPPILGEKSDRLVIEFASEGVETKILASIPPGSNFLYGDRVRFMGTLKKPENFMTDQGKEFDYVNYLKKDGIYYVSNYASIDLVSSGHGNRLKSALFFVKEKFLEKINFAIPAPESLLMGGLILGEKSAFSDKLRTQFVNTGTIHIVALSGYNVTIVAEWFMKLFSFLPQRFGISLGMLAIFLFVVMSGASSTAIRAGIMGVLVLIARATGRNYDVGRALVLTAFIMIVINPFVLVYDVSFQLSFIATIAVIFFTPKIEKYFLWVTKNFGLRDIVSVTFAAYIFVLPFILYKMGNLSLVALPANILVLPFIPFTMLLGFLTGFLGIIWYGFAVLFGYLSYLLLSYELFSIDFFANIPFASVSIPSFPLIFTILIYIYFVYVIFRGNIKIFLKELFEI